MVEVAEGGAPAEASFVEHVPARVLVAEVRNARVPGIGVGHPEQAALGLQGDVDVGDVDVEPAVPVDVAERGVHALVGVPADAAEGAPLDPSETLAALVEVEVVGTEVVRHVEIRPAVVVEVSGADGERPVGLGHAHRDHVLLLEPSAAEVPVERVQAAVRGVVPARMHERQHPPIVRVLCAR